MEIILVIENLYKYLLAFSMALILAYALTPDIARLCNRLGMVDRPDARRLHKKVTPRGGGIVIIGAFLATCGVVFYQMDGRLPGIQGQEFLHLFLFPVLVLAVVGLLDDRFGLNPWIKLAGQAGAVTLAISLGLKINRIFGWSLPVWLDIGLTLLVVLAAINAFNLIDGMDGLAAGLALIAALGLAIGFGLQREPLSVLVMLALAGACLGFLNFNFHPASIFLGDTGSMFLGYVIAAIAIHTSNKATTLATLALPFVALGVPFLDTLLAIWRRAVRRALQGHGQISRADLDHLHHRILKMGLSPRASVLILFSLASGLVIAALAAVAFTNLSLAIMMLTFGAVMYVIIRHLAFLEIWESEKFIRSQVRLIRNPTVAAIFYPVADAGLFSLCVVLAHAVHASSNDIPASAGRGPILEMLPYLVGIPVVGIALTGAYRRLWRRARPIEYLALLAGVSVAAGIGFALWTSIVGDPGGMGKNIELVFIGIAVPTVVLFRAAPRLILDLSQYLRRSHLSEKTSGRCLVYGAGEGMVLLLRSQVLTAGPIEGARIPPPYKVVGVLDDDPGLKGLTVWGYPVLGGLNTLASAAKKHGVAFVVVTTRLKEDRRAQLIKLAGELDLAVLEWQLGLSSVPTSPAQP